MTWGRMKRDSTWHEPDTGFFVIPEGTKVRRVKTKNRREREMVSRSHQDKAKVIVRLLGMRRVIFWDDAIWEE